MKKAFTLIELLLVTSFIVVLAAIALPVGARIFGVGTFSEGSRVGIVSKFSYKGTWNKSWEGDLNVGNGYQVVEVWKFSVTDDNKPVIADIKQAERAGARVELEYHQKRVKGVNTDTDYIIQKVNFLDDKGNIINR